MVVLVVGAKQKNWSLEMLVYKLSLPQPGAVDVVKRVLVVAFDGVAQPDVVLDGKALEATLSVHDNVSVVVALKDVDDAGNESPLSDPLNWVAKDTLPPAQPGLLSVVLVEEVADPVPVVVTTVAPEPVVETTPEPVVVTTVAPEPVVEPTPEPVVEPVVTTVAPEPVVETTTPSA